MSSTVILNGVLLIYYLYVLLFSQYSIIVIKIEQRTGLSLLARPVQARQHLGPARSLRVELEARPGPYEPGRAGPDGWPGPCSALLATYQFENHNKYVLYLFM